MKTIYRTLALSVLALFTAAFFGAGHTAHAADQKAGAKGQKAEPITVKDLVCGMDVETKDAKWVYEYKGTKYYFCMKGDLDTFKKDPEKFIKKGVK
ncbi:MAG: YHS domain-containing protein [Nitrospirae bacterium]|nr:YHS domain-containing protein [Nitrospirota bacterium]